MTLSIRSTITTTLAERGVNAEDYTSYIDAVEAALVGREQNLAESAINLVDARHGYEYAETAKELLGLAGFEIKPEPEEEPVTEQDPDAPVTRAEFAKLSASVESLVKLAQDHLRAAL